MVRPSYQFWKEIDKSCWKSAESCSRKFCPDIQIYRGPKIFRFTGGQNNILICRVAKMRPHTSCQQTVVRKLRLCRITNIFNLCNFTSSSQYFDTITPAESQDDHFLGEYPLPRPARQCWSNKVEISFLSCFVIHLEYWSNISYASISIRIASLLWQF